jgi:hypothetical protein
VSSVIFSAPEKVIPLEPRRDFRIAEVDALQGTRFMFRMPEGQNFPDPASRFSLGELTALERAWIHPNSAGLTENFQ